MTKLNDLVDRYITGRRRPDSLARYSASHTVSSWLFR